MPKSSSKKAAGTQALSATPLLQSLNFQRAGMPEPEAVTGIRMGSSSPFMSAESAASQYRIIETNYIDEYEKAAQSAEAFAEAAPPTGDKFGGTARKAAKISIAKAKTEEFDDLADLIASLTSDDAMRKHKPKITVDAKSNRVAEEQRNIRVTAYIYAASREDDNDFHLIIGRDPEEAPERYMTMELSGLPPSNAASFKKLKAARNAFKKFFNENFDGKLPGLKYDFYDPPIPVEIEGSLFFDMSHAKGSVPGPQKLRPNMPTIWEVHPITKMVFEP